MLMVKPFMEYFAGYVSLSLQEPIVQLGQLVPLATATVPLLAALGAMVAALDHGVDLSKNFVTVMNEQKMIVKYLHSL